MFSAVFFSYPYVIPVDILQGLENMKNLHGFRGNGTVLWKRNILNVTQKCYTEINPGSGSLWAANGQKLEKHFVLFEEHLLMAAVGEGVLGSTGWPKDSCYHIW